MTTGVICLIEFYLFVVILLCGICIKSVENIKKEYMKKKLLTAYCGVVLLLCASSGILAGLINSNGGGTSSVVDTDDESVLNKYIEVPSQNVGEYVEQDAANSYKNVLYATNTVFVKQSKYITSTASNLVAADVAGIPYNQSVSSRRIINEDDTFFQTNTISTFVKKSEQRYTNKNSYLVRQGSNPTLESADYSSSQIEALSKKDYFARYGHTNRDIFNYAINDTSFLSGKYDGKKEDGLYYFSYELQPEIATAAYVREVKYMGGSTNYPVFSKVCLTIGIDENYRVSKTTTTEVYSMPIMGGLTCSGTSEETFTYSSSTISFAEYDEFKPYFGKETGEIEKEWSAMDYLSQLGSDMESTTKLQLKGDVKVDEEALQLKLKLDLQNNAYYVDINDMLDIIYMQNNAYVLTDNSKYLVSKDEINDVISVIGNNQDIFDTSKLTDLLTNPFVSKIINGMSVSKVENYVDINIPFTDDSKIVLHLYQTKDESNNTHVTLKGVEGNLEYEGYSASINFDVVDEDLVFKQIPEDATQIQNISKIASQIKDISNKKAFYGQINYNDIVTISDKQLPVDVNGSYYVDLKDENNPLYKFELVVSINSENINIVVDGNKETFYITINDKIHFVTSYDYLVSLFNISSASISLPKIQINQLFTQLVNVIDNLTFYQDSFEFNLDSLKIDSVNGKIKFSYGQDLTVSYEDKVSISLLPFDGNLIKVEYEDATNLKDIVNFAKAYTKGNYQVNISNLEYNDLLVSGDVQVGLDTSDLVNSTAFGNVSITYKDIKADVEFYYVGKKLYVKLNDSAKLVVSYTDFEELLAEFIPSDKLPKIELPQLNVLDIINSVDASSKDISIDLSSIISSLSYKGVIDLENKEVYVEDELTSKKNISIKAVDQISSIVAPLNEYVNARPVIDSVISLYKKVISQDFSFSFESGITYENNQYNVSGIASYKKLESGYELVLSISSPISFKLTYKDSVFYIDVESSHIKASKASLVNILKQVQQVYNLDGELIETIYKVIDSGLDTYLSKLDDMPSLDASSISLALNINELIKSISYTNNKTSVSVDLSKIESSLGTISLVVNENSKVESISLESVNTSLVNLTNTRIYGIGDSINASINSEVEYLDLTCLESFDKLADINDLINNKVYSINLDEVSINGITINGVVEYLDISKLDLSVFKNETINIEDLIKLISLEAKLTIKYDANQEALQLQINVNNGNIQVKLLNSETGLTIGGTYSQLVTILDSIKNNLGTTLSTYIKDLDLSKLELPVTIANSLAKQISVDDILDIIRKYSINSIVKSLAYDKEAGLHLELDLEQFNIENVDVVTLNYKDSTLKVNVKNLVSLTLTSTAKVEDFETSYGIKTTFNFNDVNNLVNLASKYAKGNYQVNVSNLEYNGLLVSGDVQVGLDTSDLVNSTAFGNVSITYKDIKADVEFYYVGKKLYVKLNDSAKLVVSYTDFEELLAEFIPSDKLPKIELPQLNVLDIINSVDASSKDISIDLSSIISSLSYKGVIDLENKEVYVEDELTSKKNISIKAVDQISSIVAPLNEYVNARPVIDSVISLYKKVISQDFSFSFESGITYENNQYNVSGIASYKKLESGYELVLSISSPISFKLTYKDSVFYIDVESSHIKASKASLVNILKQVQQVYNLDGELIETIYKVIDSGLDTYLSKLDDMPSLDASSISLALNINELIKSISYTNNKTSVSVDLSKIESSLGTISLVVNENSKVESISLESVNTSLVNLTNTRIYGIGDSINASINSEVEYLDLTCLESFDKLADINDLINNKVYSINLDEVSINGITINGVVEYLDISKLDLSVFKNETINIEDLIKLISLEAKLTIKYDANQEALQLQINVNNGNIQVKLLNSETGLTIGGTYSQLVTILDSIKNNLGTTLSTYIKDLDLSKLELPVTIANSLAKQISVDDILDIIRKYSINSIVKSLAYDKEAGLHLELDLEQFNIENVDVVTLNYKDSTLKVNVKNLVSLTLTSTAKVEDFDNSAYGLETTCSFTDLNNLVNNVNALLNTRTFNGTLNLTNVNMNINLAKMLEKFGLNIDQVKDETTSLNANLAINFQVDMSNKFDFYLDIGFNINNAKTLEQGGYINLKADHLIVSKVGENIYFKLSNITSMLTYNEWLEVIKYFSTELGLDLNINYSKATEIIDNLSLGFDNFMTYINEESTSSNENSSSFNFLEYFDVNSILNSIAFTRLDEENGEFYVNLPLSKLATKLNIDFIDINNVGVTYNSLDGNIKLCDSIDGNILYKDVTTSSIKKIDSTNYVTKKSLKAVIDELVALKSTFTQNQFVITTSSDTSSNNVSKDGKKLFDYSGTIIIDNSSKLKFKADNVTLNVYDSNENKTSHNFTLTYLPSYTKNETTYEEDTFFIEYGPNLKGYLSRVEFANLAKYGCEFAGINNSVLDTLLNNLGSNDSIGTDIFDGITSSNKMPNFDINLDNLFDSYNISSDDNGSSFEIKVNAVDFYKSLYGEDFNKDNTDPNKNKVTIKMNSNSSRTSVSKFKLDNMYSSKQEVFNIDVDIANSLTEAQSETINTVIDVTNANNELGKYYYIGNIPTLLKAFANTADLERYHVSGKFSMALGKWNLQNIGYDVKIELDEDKHPYIEATFNCGYLFGAMSGGESKLLYSPKTNEFYLRNNKSKTNHKYSNDPSKSDYIGTSSNIAEVINTILDSWSTIKGTIKDSVSNTSTNIDINTILKNYSYNYDDSTKIGTTNVTLEGSQLMSSFSNLNVHLYNKELDMKLNSSTTKHGDYLTNFTFDTTMSVITITGSGAFDTTSTISDIGVDMDLLNKAISNPNGWSF